MLCPAASAVRTDPLCVQDFRIINMSVSPAKVKDTAELFYMQNQRKISLRYLAWYFLNMDVQVRFAMD
eukprot:COSAG03_NODE_1661_length_3701_cov_2.910050_4_plen_68_part_00